MKAFRPAGQVMPQSQKRWILTESKTGDKTCHSFGSQCSGGHGSPSFSRYRFISYSRLASRFSSSNAGSVAPYISWPSRIFEPVRAPTNSANENGMRIIPTCRFLPTWRPKNPPIVPITPNMAVTNCGAAASRLAPAKYPTTIARNERATATNKDGIASPIAANFFELCTGKPTKKQEQFLQKMRKQAGQCPQILLIRLSEKQPVRQIALNSRPSRPRRISIFLTAAHWPERRVCFQLI